MGWAGGQSHLPNSLIYKNVSQIAVCEQSESEHFEILCIFGQKNRSNFRKGSSFVRFAPSEAKKLQNFWRNAYIHKFRTRSTFEKFASSSEKILGMGAWLKKKNKNVGFYIALFQY